MADGPASRPCETRPAVELLVGIAGNPTTGPASTTGRAEDPSKRRHHFEAFFCTDGGVYLANDVFTVGNGEARSKGWKVRNRGFAAANFTARRPCVAPDKVVVVAGRKTTGRSSHDRSGNHGSGGGSRAATAGSARADPFAPGLFYTEFQYMDVRRASDDAAFVTSITGAYQALNETTNEPETRWKPAPYTLEDARDRSCNFIAPFVADPNRRDRLLAGGLSLWRTDDARARVSNDRGPKWRAIKDPIAETPDVGNHAISAVAVAPGDSNVVWVGHNNGAVYRTADGESPRPHWTEVNDVGDTRLPRDRVCNRIFIRNARKGEPPGKDVFVAFGGFNVDNLWRTNDGGSHWEPVGIGTDVGALPAASIYGITAHPNSRYCLYAATEFGVYASEDDGRTWVLSDQPDAPPTEPGTSNCSVRDLFWEGTTLYAVTHARGLFRIDIPYSVATMPARWLQDRIEESSDREALEVGTTRPTAPATRPQP